MSEDVVVSIFDENNNIEEENLLLGKVSAFWWKSQTGTHFPIT